MPHYKDGTRAQIGDMVTGRGIIGLVTSIREEISSKIYLTVVRMEIVPSKKIRQGLPVFPINVEVEPGLFETYFIRLEVSYGEIKDFEKIAV